MRASARQGNSEHVEDDTRLVRHPARVPGRVPDHADIDLSHSRHGRNCVLHHYRQFLRRRAIGRGQRHVDLHRAIVGDVDAVNQTDLVDVGRNFRIIDGLERGHDLVVEPGDLSLRERGDRGLRTLGQLFTGGANESAPTTGALPNCIQSDPQAASLVGWTSRTLLELAIGIARGFIASGTSRTRSMCRSPFSRLAPLTCTWSASWKLRSKFRAAMPW